MCELSKNLSFWCALKKKIRPEPNQPSKNNDFLILLRRSREQPLVKNKNVSSKTTYFNVKNTKWRYFIPFRRESLLIF